MAKSTCVCGRQPEPESDGGGEEERESLENGKTERTRKRESVLSAAAAVKHKRAHSPDPQARGPLSQWTEV
jgi:hypothetical protein